MNTVDCPACGGTGVSALRRSIMAPEGCVIVCRDLSQVEARVLCFIAEQDDVLEQFRAKEDVYCLMAATLFGRTITKADKKERFIGKVLTLGAGYGIGFKNFQSRLRIGALGGKGMILGEDVAGALGLSVEHFVAKPYMRKFIEESLPPGMDFMEHAVHVACCETIINLFRSNRPGISSFWKTCDEALAHIYAGEEFRFGRNNLLVTNKKGILFPNGCVMQYPLLEQVLKKRGFDYSFLKNRKRHERVKVYGASCCENLVQGLSRIIITDSMLKMHSEGLRVAHQVHDEILVVCKEDEASDVYKRMGEIMSIPPDWAEGLPIASDGGWNRRYQK